MRPFITPYRKRIKFNAVQEPLILKELNRLTNSVEVASGIGQARLNEKLAELKIYQLQLQRILRFTLYFLEIKADGKTLLLNLPIDSDRSKLLPKLTSEFLVKFVNTGVEQAEETSAFPPVNRGLTESPLTIEADFTTELV